MCPSTEIPLGQVSSQKGGEGEAGHPNSHRKKCGRI